MRFTRYLGRLLLNLKGRLPLNGDWLFVTESVSGEKQIDAADEYQAPSMVLKLLSGTVTPETTKLIYERVKSYEGTVNDIANRVYDKSKVIFGAASFASTIILALGSTLLPPLLVSSVWLRVVGAALSFFLVFHLSRALIIAAEVMIRELMVRETPGELIELGENDEGGALRELIAKVLAYAIQTQTLGLEKLNRLIIAQHSFRYALVFYFALAVLSVVVRLGESNIEGTSAGAVAEEIKDLKNKVEATSARQGKLASAVDTLEKEHALIQRELRESIELRRAELDFLRILEAQLMSGLANRQPPAATRKQP